MRVVIVEDQALLREGIVALLADHEIEVVATADDGPGLLRIIDGHKPDLAICDVRLPPTFTDEGIRAAREARRRHPELAVVVLSQYVEPEYTAELLREGNGGIGYLLKERVSDVRTFVEAVRRVAAGGTALDAEVVSTLMSMRRGASSASVEAIEARTPRERETLELIAQGAHTSSGEYASRSSDTRYRGRSTVAAGFDGSPHTFIARRKIPWRITRCLATVRFDEVSVARQRSSTSVVTSSRRISPRSRAIRFPVWR